MICTVVPLIVKLSRPLKPEESQKNFLFRLILHILDRTQVSRKARLNYKLLWFSYCAGFGKLRIFE